MIFAEYYFFIFFNMFIVLNNLHKLVDASEEFQVFRMQQFDTQGVRYGSQSTGINVEAKTINGKFLLRKCILVYINSFTIERYRYLISQSINSIIVLLPKNYNETEKENIRFMESILLKEETKIPVYFALESQEFLKYYEYLDRDNIGSTDSAFQSLLESVNTNGFQFVINAPSSQPLHDFQATNLQAKLIGNTNNKKTQKTIAIVAHYDTIGMATSLAYGCDSNGSGVAALLEISRLFSHLFSNIKTISQYNLLFILTTGGKFNYFGTRKWLEEQIELSDGYDKVDLDDIAFAICLDSLSNDNNLFMHVSKPPKEGQSAFEFLKRLETQSKKHGSNFSMIHKKINLANENIAWEHERFSINKVSAFTLSHHISHKENSRFTITDTLNSVNQNVLVRNIKIIAESLAQHIYNISDTEIFASDMEISQDFVHYWLSYICSIPRSTSLLNKNHPLINAIYTHFTTYLKNSIKLPIKLNAKDAEFVLYNEEQSTLVIYNVKPAIFDLILFVFICVYLLFVYLFVMNFIGMIDKIGTLLRKF